MYLLLLRYLPSSVSSLAEIYLCLDLDEWENFFERTGRCGSTGDADIEESSTDALELRFWVSYRGQTLSRISILVLSLLSSFLKIHLHSLCLGMWKVGVFECLI